MILIVHMPRRLWVHHFIGPAVSRQRSANVPDICKDYTCSCTAQSALAQYVTRMCILCAHDPKNTQVVRDVETAIGPKTAYFDRARRIPCTDLLVAESGGGVEGDRRRLFRHHDANDGTVCPCFCCGGALFLVSGVAAPCDSVSNGTIITCYASFLSYENVSIS